MNIITRMGRTPGSETKDRLTAQVFSANRVLVDKYKLGRMLGEGGMGTVYQAEHIGLQAQVAVKILSESGVSDERSLERFRREARAMGAIRHENVVSVMDTGTDEKGVPFLVMELLRGESLAAMLRRERRLDISVACWILQQILPGLSAAHAKGIVHRDLKPGNVFVARRDDGNHVVKVLDFGISKLETTDAVNVTADGALVGTPNFMAPEQIRATDVDHRADLYAAGVILYRMTTGVLPFSGTAPEDLYRAVIRAKPKAPRELRPEMSERLEALILRAMHPNRDQRFQDAVSFHQELVATMAANPNISSSPALPIPPTSGSPASAYVPRVPVPLSVDTPKLTRRSALIAGSIVLVAGLASVAAWMSSRDSVVEQTPSVTPLPELKPGIRFGITRFKPPDEIAAEFSQLTGYLSQQVGYRVDLVVVENYTDLSEKVIAGEVDLAALSAATYVRARRREPKLQLLATPISETGDTTYEGYIMATRNSGIRRLEDLSGRVFCYVSPNSTSGYLYPRALFRKSGINPNKFFSKTRFTQDHTDSLRALIQGRCDGAAVYARAWLGAEAAGIDPVKLTVVDKTEPIPWDAYVVSPQLDKKIVRALQDALIELEPDSETARKVFSNNQSPLMGFRPTTDEFYDGVRSIEAFVDDN